MKHFRIWQVRTEHIRQYGFRASDEVCGPYRERGLPREVYDCVYEGEAEQEPCLDELYLAFNAPHPFPEGYRGRSMSLGDLVEYAESGELWFCDAIGWTPVSWEAETCPT